MSGATKLQLQESIRLLSIDCREEGERADRGERDAARARRERDRALLERDAAWTGLQDALTSEQQLRDALRLSDHLNRGLQDQLEAARERAEAADARVGMVEEQRNEAWANAANSAARLEAEQATRSRVEGDLRKKLDEVANERLELAVKYDQLSDDAEDWADESKKLDDELARTVQTSHDREAALHDLVIAVTRSKL